MSDELNVKIVVDATQLQGGMEQAASTVQSASVKMAESLKAAGMSATDAASALKNLGFSTIETSDALQKVGLSAASTAASVEATTVALGGMDRAMAMASGRIAGMALGSGMLGGALGRVGAYSSTLGPLLSAAFPIIGAIALVDIVSKLPNIFREIIDAIAGWDDASKKAYSELIASNTQMLLESTRLKIQVEALNEVGAKGGAKYGLAVRDSVDAQKAWGATSAELLHMQQSLTAEIEKMRQAPETVPFAAPLAHFIGESSDKMKQLRKELDEVNKALEVATRAQQELSQVGVPKAQKEQSSAAIEDQKREQENWAREQERLGKEAEEGAVKRGDAERKTIEDKERLDEEGARVSEQMAQRDLQSWQKILIEKTRITEEQGKAQLDQIRANAQLTEKATEDKSVLGGADPAIAQEARAATQQQVAVIQQMIAAEQQLQTTLKATGAAQDDPKIEESIRRQAELTQQINKAWDDYAKKVQQVAAAQTGLVKGEMSSLFSSLNSNLVQMVNGQEGIVRGIQKIWTGLVDSLIVDFAKMGEKWLMQHVIMAAASKIFHLQDAASAATSAAAATASAKVAGLAQVGLAGAGGVASMAAAPFPIDLTAPGFGAAMAASAAGLLAFESGGMVPGYGPVPAIVHGGEMILNQDQQRALGSGGGNNTFNFNHNGGGSSEQVRTSSKEFFRQAKREMRRMNR